MKFTHFIFDLDGTLIDTEAAVLKTWRHTLKEYGYDFNLDQLRVVLGVVTSAGLEKLNANVDDNYAQKWRENYAVYAKEADFFPGVKQMLQSLRDSGCSLGVVSSRNIPEYEQFFTSFELEQYFPVIILEEDTVEHKPDPEPLMKYLELTHANRESCVYIGDMPTDIQCANSAGMTSGLVTWNGSGITCNAADMIFARPADIIRLSQQ